MAVEKVTIAQVKNIAEYEKVRPAFRDEIIALKKRRRISVGPVITLLFENASTVLFQVQEMMRVERIVHDEAIQWELDTYNQLLPNAPGELGATLFIEITQESDIQLSLEALMGVDSGDCVYIEVAGQRIEGNFEAGHSSDIKLSAVHYVHFQFSPEQVNAFKDMTQPAAIVVSHPNYKHRTEMPQDIRESLREDLV